MNAQLALIEVAPIAGKRQYLPFLTASENEKGVLDVDTVKGCTIGMRSHEGGCYGECYAAKTASRYGIDFSVSVTRRLTQTNRGGIFHTVKNHSASWYRIGVAGDPCHDWGYTLEVCEFLQATGKVPVIITKHWIPLSDEQIVGFYSFGTVFNTSVSGFDTIAQLAHRVRQIQRLKAAGIRSIARVVTCEYGTTEWGRAAKYKQDFLLTLDPVIDNPLRADSNSPRVVSGDILLTRRDDSIGGGKFVSLHSPSVYLGKCAACPDQCGVLQFRQHKENESHVRTSDFVF